MLNVDRSFRAYCYIFYKNYYSLFFTTKHGVIFLIYSKYIHINQTINQMLNAR